MQFIAPFVVRKHHRLMPVVAFVLTVCVITVLLLQPVFAANTYVIKDGDQVMVHTSYAVDPGKVLSEAGIRLDEDDFYTTQTTEGGSEIMLQRSQSVTVDYCGEVINMTTYGESLESLLSRSGLNYTGSYQVSKPVSTQTYDGMAVTVQRVVENQETYTVEIPFDVVYCQDDTLPAGQEQVLSKGIPGQKLCKADAVYVNGEETSRTVLEETITREPQTQVVAVGTGKNVGEERTQPMIGDGVIVLPSGEVLTYTRAEQFLATGYTHLDEGCDMTTSTGTTVRHGTVAVDPTVIPYGTRMFIVSNDGAYVYGLSTAEDCGGAIQDKRLDLYFDNLPAAFQFGVRNCTVYFLGDANWTY